MKQYTFVSEVQTAHGKSYLANIQSAVTRAAPSPGNVAVDANESNYITLLPTFTASDEKMNAIVFGLKIVTALFREMRDRRVNLKSTFFIVTELGEALVARVYYPTVIQVAIEATVEMLPQLAELRQPLPTGMWTPYVKLTEGLDLRRALESNIPSTFGAMLDEPLSAPQLLVKEKGGWERCKSWVI